MENGGKKLGELLLEMKVLTEEALSGALEEQKKSGMMLGEVLLKRKLVDKKTLGNVLEAKLDIPYVNLSEYDIDRDVVLLFSRDFVKTNYAIPVKKEDGVLFVATPYPQDEKLIEKLKENGGMEIMPLLTTSLDIDETLNYYYGMEQPEAVAEVLKNPEKAEEAKKAPDAPRDAPGAPAATGIFKEKKKDLDIPRLVIEALSDGASRIHIQAAGDGLRIRFRVNGILEDRHLLNKDERETFMKNMAAGPGITGGLRGSNYEIPVQIPGMEEGRKLFAKVSRYDTEDGISAVIRMRERLIRPPAVGELGFSGEDLVKIREISANPKGLVLIAGPAGSGRTSTAYALLAGVNAMSRKVITLEDPVECRIPGIEQIHIRTGHHGSFASAVASSFDLDADVFMVGELTDPAAAKLVVDRALSGRTVIAPVNAGDVFSALEVLSGLGADTSFVARAVTYVIAQRIVRVICPKCSEKYTLTAEESAKITLTAGMTGGFKKGKGCPECGDSGYKGRTGIFEVLKVTPALRELLASQAPVSVLKETAVKEGMRTLYENGMTKVLSGTTTAEELLRVLEENNYI